MPEETSEISANALNESKSIEHQHSTPFNSFINGPDQNNNDERMENKNVCPHQQQQRTISNVNSATETIEFVDYIQNGPVNLYGNNREYLGIDQLNWDRS